MGPVLKAFLEGVPLAELGDDAEAEVRADIGEQMAESLKLVTAWDDAVEQIGRLSHDLDAKGREYAGAHHGDERLRAGLFHVGWAYSRAQQAIAHVGNLMRQKAWGQT